MAWNRILQSTVHMQDKRVQGVKYERVDLSIKKTEMDKSTHSICILCSENRVVKPVDE